MLRRTFGLWWTTCMVALIGVASAIAPPSAGAAVISLCEWEPTSCQPAPATPTAGVRHVGWVYLNLNYCPPAMMCAAIYRDSMAAWSWTGSSWRQSTLRQGWVYVYPYTGSWRWAWTQQSGWVAVNSGRFEIRRY